MDKLKHGTTKLSIAIEDVTVSQSRLVERTQYDTMQDHYSALTATDTGTEQITRQEFRDDADINNILNRMGVNAPQRPLKYGEEIDYTLDLQTALEALDAVKVAEFDVPPELRNRYPTWREVLNGVESGQYQHDLSDLAAKKAAAKQGKPPGQPPDPVADTTTENSEQAAPQ